MTPALPDKPRRRRWASVVAGALIALGVAHHLPSLSWGFIWDDYFHQLVLRDRFPGIRATAWNLYNFDLRAEAGTLLFDHGLPPWWTDSDFHIRFFRPVTSASLRLDSALFGDNATGYHATSIALFGVLMLLTWRLFVALDMPPRATLLALLFIALDDVYGVPVGWLANRNALLATIFILATALAMRHYTERRRAGWLALALTCQLLAFGSKESGIVAGPIALVVLLLTDPRGEGRRWMERGLLLARSPATWIVGGLAVLLVGSYAAAGYGAKSLVYLAPWSDPHAYAERLGILLPVALLSLFFGIPADLLSLGPQVLHRGLLMAAVLLPIGGAAITLTLRRSRPAAFALAWLVLSLLVEVGSDITDRLFATAAIGSALLIGLFVDQLCAARPRVSWRTVPAWLVALPILAAATVGGVYGNWLRNKALVAIGTLDRQSALEAPVPPGPHDVLLLNAPSSLCALSFSCTRIAEHGDDGLRSFPLQYGRTPLILTRDDDRTLTLRATSRPMADGKIERLFRTSATPRPVGTTFATAAFSAEILETRDDGYAAVRLRFEHTLDDPRYLLLDFRDGRYVRLSPPPIGGSFETSEVVPLFPGVP